MGLNADQFDEHLHILMQAAFKEDLGDGDHSTLAVIPANTRGRAVLKIKQEGILAGVQIAQNIIQYREPSASFIIHKKDGEVMRSGNRHLP